ncbi:hypothetical protein HHL22_01430 [Hymenobacter sp. RP-2-7]|uniref:Phosphoribosylpyrophosphate synthetase n=1 Tax=Hymenobacter polaris TaxID=2682546 RepID=A0A7Y0FL00_9BACT|nr:hypothetical protein [Hymenobacter polaris]NML63856.1 hypothetical protein [Hymenobacter polaris]
MTHSATLSETLAALLRTGYTETFTLRPDCLAGQRSAILLGAHEFEVTGHYHPADAPPHTVVYAIFSARFNLRGTLVHDGTEAGAGLLVAALQAKAALVSLG